ELSDNTLSTDLKLFNSRPGTEWKMANYRGFIGSALFFAPNAPSGLILDYYSKSAGAVRITVKDKAGNQVRTLTNARAEAGVINRSTWDFRYDSPVPPAFGGATAGAGGGGRGGRGGGGGG